MKLNDFFCTEEFECKCCGKVLIDAKLLGGLQELRVKINKPVIITSGYRCEKHNSEVGGRPGSYHLQGKAADIVVKGMTPEEVAKLAETIDVFKNGGIGVYKSWVHVDVRGYKARW